MCPSIAYALAVPAFRLGPTRLASRAPSPAILEMGNWQFAHCDSRTVALVFALPARPTSCGLIGGQPDGVFGFIFPWKKRRLPCR